MNATSKVFRQFYYQPIVGLDDALVERAAELAAGGQPQTKASVLASLNAVSEAKDTSSDSESGDARTFDVAAILDRRVDGDGAHYLVQWEGFPVADATWEPETHLEGALEAVSAFLSCATWWIW